MFGMKLVNLEWLQILARLNQPGTAWKSTEKSQFERINFIVSISFLI